jgi:hypothetical protein
VKRDRAREPITSVGEDRSEKNRLLLETIQPAVLTEEP